MRRHAMPTKWLALLLVLIATIVAGCAGETVEVPKEVVVTQEVVKEVKVPGETVVVTKEVIKEVPREVVVIKEVIKEVPREVVVTKEVIREVPREVVVTKEVIKEVPVEKIVTVEKEVIKEVKVPGETIVVEREVVRPATYGEAPVLAALVRAGKLPPVEQRLPSNPLVIPVVEEIGRYGGVWKRAFTGPGRSVGAQAHLGRLLPRVGRACARQRRSGCARVLGCIAGRQGLHLPSPRGDEVVRRRALQRRRHHVLVQRYHPERGAHQ